MRLQIIFLFFFLSAGKKQVNAPKGPTLQGVMEMGNSSYVI